MTDGKHVNHRGTNCAGHRGHVMYTQPVGQVIVCDGCGSLVMVQSCLIGVPDGSRNDMFPRKTLRMVLLSEGPSQAPRPQGTATVVSHILSCSYLTPGALHTQMLKQLAKPYWTPTTAQGGTHEEQWVQLREIQAI